MRTSTTTAVLLGAAGAVVLLGTPALAHVTVQSPGATQGGFAKVTFRVPTEKAVPTTKVQVVFPADAPLANAGVKPHPGWTYTVVKTKPATPLKDDDGNTVEEVVQSITWTATAGGIKPGEFDEFDISAGPFPKTDQMEFKALQTYGDGSVVRWIEPAAAAGGAEPEHPAPVLKLAPAADESGSASPSAAASPSASSGPSVSAVGADSSSTDDGSDKTSKGLAFTALGLAAVALLVALAGLLRGRDRQRAASSS